MLEILNTLHSVTLNYGTITRDSPFRYTFTNVEFLKTLISTKILICTYAYEYHIKYYFVVHLFLDWFVRLLVECRYLPGTVASVGYLVKSPSLGPSIQAQGVFGVQLRIAKGQCLTHLKQQSYKSSPWGLELKRHWGSPSLQLIKLAIGEWTQESLKWGNCWSLAFWPVGEPCFRCTFSTNRE